MLSLSVLRVHLPSDIPIVGCELGPYVVLRRPDNTITTDDVPESASLDGLYLRYKWFRVQSDRKVALCSIHPTEYATLQCIGCVKAKIPVSKSYHCSSKCFSDAWQHHRALHERAASAVNENAAEDEELFGRFGSSNLNASSAPAPASNTKLNNGPNTPLYPAFIPERSGNGETWFEVGCSKIYTPTHDDVGHVLKFECVIADAETKVPVGSVNTITTSLVIPAPSPTPRRLISVNGVDQLGLSDGDGRSSSHGTFTVLSYNILADVYASSELYSYCPSWALSWSYRRQNLLREIVGYRADIICLQEVQIDQFDQFFAPELDKHGYQALYKKKTAEVLGRNYFDGCATFFRRDKFSHVKKYEVEFNKAAQSLTEAMAPSVPKKTALNRLLKDNIALIAVLEAKFGGNGTDTPGNRQLICVANTHVDVNQDIKDVKLWQVHTLLKGLEKIAVSADIPMLVCGDFNSVPDSAPHALLASGKVDPTHADLAVDPLGILRPVSKLTHQLPLVSAYSSFTIPVAGGISLEQQRRRMDTSTNEPLFTNCTRDFIGTVDYIFHTADSLMVESLLELLDEENLRKDTALPSPEWSSDHIALMVQFRCKPRIRR